MQLACSQTLSGSDICSHPPWVCAPGWINVHAEARMKLFRSNKKHWEIFGFFPLLQAFCFFLLLYCFHRLVILLRFYFCLHMLSQLCFLLPTSLCLCHHLTVRNWIKLASGKPGMRESYRHACTHVCRITPLLGNSHPSLLFIYFCLHAWLPIFICFPPASLFISSSSLWTEEISVFFLQNNLCSFDKPPLNTCWEDKLYYIVKRNLRHKATVWKC